MSFVLVFLNSILLTALGLASFLVVRNHSHASHVAVITEEFHQTNVTVFNNITIHVNISTVYGNVWYEELSTAQAEFDTLVVAGEHRGAVDLESFCLAGQFSGYTNNTWKCKMSGCSRLLDETFQCFAYSLFEGGNTTVKDRTLAVGDGSYAGEPNSIALGAGSSSTQYGVMIGSPEFIVDNNIPYGGPAIYIGTYDYTTPLDYCGDYSIHIGHNCRSDTSGTMDGNICIGTESRSSGESTLVLGGYNNTADGFYTVSLGGHGNNCDGLYTVCSGVNSVAVSSEDSVFRHSGGLVSATGYITTSDMRLKKNITEMSNILDLALLLEVVTYNYTQEFGGKYNTGFIAQQVEQIFPFATSTAPGDTHIGNSVFRDFKRVKKTALFSYFVRALQELTEEINSRLDALG